MKKILILLVCFLAVTAQRSYDYDKMKKEFYDSELLKWRNEATASEASIKKSDAEIAKLQAELGELNASADKTWNDTYAMLGQNNDGSKAAFDAYMDKTAALRKDVNAFMAQSAEEAYRNRKDLDKYQAQLDALKSERSSAMSSAESSLASIQSLIDQGRNKAKLPNSMYEVQRGDYLWKIAKKADVYGDAYAWTRLYNANKAQIKDPNLIFPKQVFTVARTVEYNQYLVTKGDNLFKIAQQNGGAFTWMQLYQANQSLLTDANVIMPYQVLTLPNK
jgi:nucleoid-associated protein YgaU